MSQRTMKYRILSRACLALAVPARILRRPVKAYEAYCKRHGEEPDCVVHRVLGLPGWPWQFAAMALALLAQEEERRPD